MALLYAAMMAAASLCVAAPAHAAFGFDRTDVSLSLGANQGLTDVAVGDLDGANGPDIVVSARGENRVSVLRNQGDGSFAGPVGYSACAPLTGAPGQIVTGQLNVAQDQQLDVAVACGVLTVLPGNGAGALGAPVPTALASSGSLAAGELTGGGGPELLTGEPTANAAGDLLCFVIQPFELADIRCGNPAPVQDPPLLASTLQGPLAGTQTPIAVNFSDPLGRRYDEVLGINPLNTREVNVYGREPGSNFTAWSSTMRATSADRAYFLDVGDVEGDGDRDLLVGHLQGGVLDVFVWGRSGILPGAVPSTTQTIGSPPRTASSRTSTVTARSTWWWRDSRAVWRSSGAGATARLPWPSPWRCPPPRARSWRWQTSPATESRTSSSAPPRARPADLTRSRF